MGEKKLVASVEKTGMVDRACTGKIKWNSEWHNILLRYLDLSEPI